MKRVLYLLLFLLVDSFSIDARDYKDIYSDQAWEMYKRINSSDPLLPGDSYDNVLKLFLKAEKLGNNDNYNVIGYIYANYHHQVELFRTLPRKEYRAKIENYYKKAIATGAYNAYYNLGQCYEGYMYEAVGFEYDFEKAVSYYKKGAEVSNPFCLVHLGNYYRDGVLEAGESKLSGEVAFSYYTRAYESDPKHGQACLELGKCYENGIGVDADLSKAAWFYEAGAPYDDECLVNAALCYEVGKGVQRDIKKACDMYGRALDNFYTADWVIEHYERLSRKLGREY